MAVYEETITRSGVVAVLKCLGWLNFIATIFIVLYVAVPAPNEEANPVSIALAAGYAIAGLTGGALLIAAGEVVALLTEACNRLGQADRKSLSARPPAATHSKQADTPGAPLDMQTPITSYNQAKAFLEATGHQVKLSYDSAASLTFNVSKDDLVLIRARSEKEFANFAEDARQRLTTAEE